MAGYETTPDRLLGFVVESGGGGGPRGGGKDGQEVLVDNVKVWALE